MVPDTFSSPPFHLFSSPPFHLLPCGALPLADAHLSLVLPRATIQEAVANARKI
jgi:hypothetical protein